VACISSSVGCIATRSEILAIADGWNVYGEDEHLGLLCPYLYYRSIRAIAAYLRMGRGGDLLVYVEEAALSGSFFRVCRPVESPESVADVGLVCRYGRFLDKENIQALCLWVVG
jgi:hypothetical protein